MPQSTSVSVQPIDKRRSTSAGRLYFMDHLRAAIILLVIILHASMTYMSYAPDWWYVVEKDHSLVFTVLVLLLDVPIMSGMFFIAGFFAYPSLEKYGAGGFLRQKAIRIGLPWLFGVLFIAPFTSYMIAVRHGVAGPYLEFWATEFWGPYYQQSVYWFLGILLMFFILLAGIYKGVRRMQHIQSQIKIPGWWFFAGFWALTAAWFFLSTTAIPADNWINSLILISFQPARLLVYAGYLALGIYADRRGWFRGDGYRPGLYRWGALAFAAGLVYLGLRLSWAGMTGVAPLVAQALLFNGFCLASIMTAAAIFQRWVNTPTPLWSSLGRNAFAIYYTHPLILLPAAYLGLSIDGSIFIEFLLLSATTAVVAWGLGAFVLTRLPGLREVF